MSQLRSFSFCIVILIPVLHAPTARLRGPIIVNAAPQLICRYAAFGRLGWQAMFFASEGMFSAGAQNARPYCYRTGFEDVAA